MEQENQSKTRIFILFLFILIVFPKSDIKAQNIDSTTFVPQIKLFEGYLTKIVFKKKNYKRFQSDYYYRFYIFSKDSLSKVKFKFKKGETTNYSEFVIVSDSIFTTKYTYVNTSRFWLKDTSLILIFFGGSYPASLKKYYHNYSDEEYRHKLPDFIEENIIEKSNYTINNIKVKFEAYSFQEYKSYIGKKDYTNLMEWFYFGKIILPEIVKSKNKFYIANYFY